MQTVDDLSPATDDAVSLPVQVMDVDRNVGRRRRAELTLIDLAGNPLTLVDYEGAELSVTWQEGHVYFVSNCPVRPDGHSDGPTLEPSKKTTVKSTMMFIILGDSHIGRSKHPQTGVPIDPMGALKSVVDSFVGAHLSGVIHTGDLFHDTAGDSEVTEFKRSVLDPLEETNTKLYYVRGNHGSARIDYLLSEYDGSALHHLDTSGVSVAPHVHLAGIDHQSGGDIALDLVRMSDLQANSVSILVLHQTIKQLSGGGADHVDLNLLGRQVADTLDYVIAGHHHDARMEAWQGITLMYAGATVEISKNHAANDRVCHFLYVWDGGAASVQIDIP